MVIYRSRSRELARSARGPIRAGIPLAELLARTDAGTSNLLALKSRSIFPVLPREHRIDFENAIAFQEAA